MELEDLDEKVEWEASRIAAAISASEFQLTYYAKRPFTGSPYSATGVDYRGLWDETQVKWTIVAEGVALQSLRIGDPGSPMDTCVVFRWPIDSTRDEIVWGPWLTLENSYKSQMRYTDQMVRTLYRLGIDIEDEPELISLNVSLTTQERGELRLSLPREFWPKTWLEEAEGV